MEYFAHSGTPNDKTDWQHLDQHSRNVARLAAQFAASFGLERAAYLAGLLHDLGKYTPAFQERLAGSKDAVDHSTAGASHINDLVKKPSNDWLMAQLIAYGILGHHAGLPDRRGPTGFDERIDRFGNDPRRALDACWRDALQPDGKGLFPSNFQLVGEHTHFRLALVTRMIFSCLVDADFKDTESFYCSLEGLQKDRHWPALPDILPLLLTRFDSHMAGLGDGQKPIDVLRTEILAHVRSKAGDTPGLFTLTVPTGGEIGRASCRERV